MNEWVRSNGGMILTGENWNIGRKTLYSVGGRWKNEYGAMVEWYWQGKAEDLGEKHYTAWVVYEWMSVAAMVEWYWQGKVKYWENKILYSVGGWWMNECGSMVEWYWQGKSEVLGEKHYTAWVVDEWMSMEQWWNDTDRGNWSAWRKKLYSVGGRRMNEYGAMVERYWQGKSEVLGEKHYTAWVVDEWMSMEQWWNDTDRGKWSTGRKPVIV